MKNDRLYTLLSAFFLGLMMCLGTMGVKALGTESDGLENGWQGAEVQTMEDAKAAVKNMRVGWNVGNSLDSNSGDVKNMWIEKWTSRTPKDYETAWGQAQTTRELIHLFKEAGFNAIRVPVTWYPHYGTLNNNGLEWDMTKWKGYTVNSAWMKRVKQVVDDILAEGMYCILNVHHDTGTASTAWVVASMESHEQYQERFVKLWTAIANQFKDYGDHLLFEGYNEMTDKHKSWCFASFGAPGNYNAADAKDAYSAVNAYAQDFVAAVRSTGGRNLERNLIVNTYAACAGAGTWNTHLQDPLKQMLLPQDSVTGHILFQVHSYWNTNNWGSSMKTEVNAMLNNLNTYLIKKHGVPVVIGEWGSDSENLDYSNEGQRKKLLEFATYFIQRAKLKDIACFYWMGLSDGQDRAKAVWTQPELRDAIIKGFYGEEGYVDGISKVSVGDSGRMGDENDALYNLNGQRISEMPRRGIYVHGGKKVVKR